MSEKRLCRLSISGRITLLGFFFSSGMLVCGLLSFEISSWNLRSMILMRLSSSSSLLTASLSLPNILSLVSSKSDCDTLKIEFSFYLSSISISALFARSLISSSLLTALLGSNAEIALLMLDTLSSHFSIRSSVMISLVLPRSRRSWAWDLNSSKLLICPFLISWSMTSWSTRLF